MCQERAKGTLKNSGIPGPTSFSSSHPLTLSPSHPLTLSPSLLPLQKHCNAAFSAKWSHLKCEGAVGELRT